MANDEHSPAQRYHIQRTLAREEADEGVRSARREVHSGLATLYIFVANAFSNATTITMMSRARTVPAAHEFTGAYARLEEYLDRIQTISKLDALLDLWPTELGVTFSWKAGTSVLDVTLAFARMIASAGTIAFA